MLGGGAAKTAPETVSNMLRSGKLTACSALANLHGAMHGENMRVASRVAQRVASCVAQRIVHCIARCVVHHIMHSAWHNPSCHALNMLAGTQRQPRRTA